jgi:hypothetical protein
MATNTKSAAGAAAAAPAATDTPTKPSRAYFTATVDEDSGEVTETNRFRYLPGHPRQVRFDAKAGSFNIGGTVPLGNSLEFVPLAWRIFSDNILNMGRKTWAELFYVDEKGAVCAVLFHGYSVENLYRLIEPLFYDDLTLADVKVKVTPEKKQTTKEGKTATYYIAAFSYSKADPAEVQALREFAEDFAIWREETYTGLADLKTSNGYTAPQADEQPAQLEAAEAAPAAT